MVTMTEYDEAMERLKQAVSDVVQTMAEKLQPVIQTMTEMVAETMKQITGQDLVKYGLIPELIGRLPITATLENLTEDDLVKIMTEPKNAIVKQYQRLFEMDGVELKFKDNSLTEIAKLAIDLSGLNSSKSFLISSGKYCCEHQ